MFRRAVAVLFLGVGWLVGGTAVASGHAVLVGTDPAYGTVLAPDQDHVSVSFDEPVTVAGSGLAVLDRDGDRVETGAVRYADADHTIATTLPADLPDGTYLLSWVILSADGHTIGGSSVFGIGTPPDTTRTAPAPDPLLAALDTMVRLLSALGHLGIVLALGLPTIVLLCRPAAAATVRQWSRAGAALIAVSALAVFALTPGRLGGSAGWADVSVWIDTLTSTTGTTALLRALGAVVLFLVLGRVALVIATRDASASAATPENRTNVGVVPGDTARPVRDSAHEVGAQSAGAEFRVPLANAVRAVAPAVAAGLIIVVAAAASGHAMAGPNRAVAVASTALHIAAMAVWGGGLAAALLVWRGTARRDGLRRFGVLALGAVAVLAVTGTFQAVRGVEPVAALWTTSWGRLLVAKLLLIVVALVLAYSIRRTVRGEGVAARGQGTIPRVLLRGESAVLGVVLVVSAVLAGIAPARDAYDPPVHTTVALGPLTAVLDVDGAGSGEQEFTVRITDEQGTPLEVLGLTGRLTREDDTLPLDLDFRRVTPIDRGPDHFVAEPRIPGRGDWRLRLTVTVDRTTAYAATTPYRVW